MTLEAGLILDACKAFGVKPWEWETIPPHWQAVMIADIGRKQPP